MHSPKPRNLALACAQCGSSTPYTQWHFISSHSKLEAGFPLSVYMQLRLPEVRSFTCCQSHLTPRPGLWKLITSFQRASTTYRSWKLLTKIIAKDGAVRFCTFISAKSITKLITTWNKRGEYVSKDLPRDAKHYTEEERTSQLRSPANTTLTTNTPLRTRYQYQEPLGTMHWGYDVTSALLLPKCMTSHQSWENTRLTQMEGHLQNNQLVFFKKLSLIRDKQPLMSTCCYGSPYYGGSDVNTMGKGTKDTKGPLYFHNSPASLKLGQN